MSKRRHEPAAPDPNPTAPAWHSQVPTIVWVALALGVYLVAEFPQALRVPFYADDFLFLDKTRDASFLSLWKLQGLAFNYYRPWSRELQYWLHQRFFGVQELPFHVVAFGLWLAILTLYFALARKLMGTVGAAISTAGAASLASWSVLLMWIAGLQELWMLAFAVGSLLAFVHARRVLALAFFVLALLSKETASVLPAIALGYCLLVERLPVRSALRRTAPLWAIVLVWAAIHPLLGGRLWRVVPVTPSPWRQSPATILVHAVLALVNLDETPKPAIGWPGTLQYALVGVVPLALLVAAVWWVRREKPPERSAASAGRIVGFGALWMILGWLPLVQPTVPWVSYYALLGTLGAWLVIGLVLSRWPWVAVSVVCALVVVRVARATTPSTSWGSEWYQARASIFILQSRDYFKSRYPGFPPHSRIYLSNVPGAIGLVPGGEESIVMQVWYGDTTLRTFYSSRFRPRDPGEPQGRDYFFAFEPGRGWKEEETGGLSANPTPAQREEYADRMFKIRQFKETLYQYQRLVELFPDRADYAFNVGSCYYQMGDSAQAARWYARAASLPGAPEQMKRAARRLARFLPP